VAKFYFCETASSELFGKLNEELETLSEQEISKKY
jgi:hypothetical protein